MKTLALAVLVIALVLAGCGKVAEARNAIKTMSTTVDAAKEMARSATGDAGKTRAALTEDSVRRYYAAVVKLNQKYPGIEFENAIVATVQAGSQGKDLKRIVPAETGLSFDDYSGLSGAILAVAASGSVAALGEMVPQMEAAIKQLEAADTSRMTAEQKTAHEQAIAAQKQALEQARAQVSPQAQADKAQLEMVMRIRKEAGL